MMTSPRSLKDHVFGQQAVGADDDVHLARGQLRQGLALLRRRLEAAQDPDLHRVVGQPAAEGLVVLLRQHRGGHQHGHLLAVHGGLERGPHRHFGLAVAHVAANQPVHGLIRGHVRQDLLDGLLLVRGLGEFEGGLELPVYRVRRRKVVARQHPAQGIKLHQFPGDLLHRLFDPPLGALPGLAPQALHPGLRAFHPQVFLHQVEAVHRQVEAVAVLVFQFQKVVGLGADAELHQPPVDADAVVQVDDVIAFLEVGQGGQVLGRPRFLAPPPLGPEPQGLVFGEDDEPLGQQPKAPGKLAHGDFHPAAGLPGGGEIDLHLQFFFLQQPGQAFGPVPVKTGQDHVKAAPAPLFQAVGQGRHQPAGLGPGLGQLLGQTVVFLHLELQVLFRMGVAPGQQRTVDGAEAAQALFPGDLVQPALGFVGRVLHHLLQLPLQVERVPGHHHRLRRQHLPQGLGLVVKFFQVAFDAGEMAPFLDVFPKLRVLAALAPAQGVFPGRGRPAPLRWPAAPPVHPGSPGTAGWPDRTGGWTPLRRPKTPGAPAAHRAAETGR